MIACHISAQVPRPSREIDIFSLLNLLLLVVGLCSLQNRYFLMPGIPIDLPKENFAIEEQLPFASKIVIVDGDHFIFGGNICGRREVAGALATASEDGKRCLLIFAARHALLEDFLFVAKAAKNGGFESVQIASSSGRRD